MVKEIQYVITECGCWNCTSHSLGGNNGYPRKRLNGKIVPIHRLMFKQEYGPIPIGMNVLHLCDNSLCINPEHLFLGTQEDNIRDRVAKGRSCRGEKNPKAKLTEEQVLEIRRNGDYTRRHARELGLEHSTLLNIKNKTTWAWL